MSRSVRALVRVRACEQWWVPLAVFVGFRVIDALFIVLLAPGQRAIVHGEPTYVLDNMPAAPSYLQVLTNCDGQWYKSIATHGYPAYLPRDPFGHVQMNSWAFYPLLPLASRAIMALTGAGFPLAASSISLVCAAAATVLFYRLVRQSGGSFLAALCVVALNAFLAAPIFQAAYTEGIALLLIVSALWLLRRRKYGWLAACGVILAMARPVVAALAIVIAIHGIIRWRRDAEFGRRDRLWCATAFIIVSVSWLLWPIAAGYVTGTGDAYQLTQNAWVGWRWDSDYVPWNSWLVLALHLNVYGLMALGLLAFTVWRMMRPSAAAYGSELRLWAPAYLFYLFVTTRNTPSWIRYDMLALVPLWPAPMIAPRRQWIRAAIFGAVIASGLVLQWLWIDRNLIIHSGAVRCP